VPAPRFDSAVAIANPAAGGGRVERRWPAWEAALAATYGPIRVLRTEAPGHAAVLAREAVWGGAEVVLSIGGDGTHGDVVAGIVKAGPAPDRITVGAVSAGTGGDFQRMLTGPREPFAALAALRSASAHPIDVGCLEYTAPDGLRRERIFLNECSLGMSALVCEGVNGSGKPLGGLLTYFGHTLSALARWESALVRVTVDGQVAGDWAIATVMIANGRYAGGGMCFAPDARLGDGMLDVAVVPLQSPARMILAVAPHLYLGTLGRSQHATRFRGLSIAVESLRSTGVRVEADGDPIGGLPIAATSIPGAIRMLGVSGDRL
jgi:YegS/Rv2252/BmrU family lipid kinase